MTKNSESTAVKGHVQYINPDTLNKNPTFTNVVVVSGPVKTVYVGGQDAVDTSGEIVGKGDLAAQTEQILKNIQAGFEAFQRFWGNRTRPPAISVMYVAGLANPDFLAEMDAIAVVPQ